jgi:hypothetical protein
MYPTEAGFHVGMASVFHGEVSGRVMGLGAMPALPNGTDVNECRQHGVYSIRSNTAAETMQNLPIAQAGTLRVFSGNGTGAEEGAYVYVVQEFIDYSGRKRFTRNVYTSGATGEWEFGNWLPIGIGAADFVIETGKVTTTSPTGAWAYKKWNSGSYEMWGVFDVSPTLDTTYGSLIRRSAQIQIPTPFNVASAIVTGTSLNDAYIVNGAYTTDSKYITFRLHRPMDFGTGKYSVRLHVTGTLG